MVLVYGRLGVTKEVVCNGFLYPFFYRSGAIVIYRAYSVFAGYYRFGLFLGNVVSVVGVRFRLVSRFGV